MSEGNESGDSKEALVSEAQQSPFYMEFEPLLKLASMYSEATLSALEGIQRIADRIVAKAGEYTDLKVKAFSDMTTQLVKQLGEENDEKVDGLRTEMRDFFEKDLMKRVESILSEFSKGELSDKLEKLEEDIEKKRGKSIDAYDRRLKQEYLKELLNKLGEDLDRKYATQKSVSELGDRLDEGREESEKTVIELRQEVVRYRDAVGELRETSVSKTDLGSEVEKLRKQIQELRISGLNEKQRTESGDVAKGILIDYLKIVHPSPEKGDLKVGDVPEGVATVVPESAPVEEQEKTDGDSLADVLKEADEQHGEIEKRKKKKD